MKKLISLTIILGIVVAFAVNLPADDKHQPKKTSSANPAAVVNMQFDDQEQFLPIGLTEEEKTRLGEIGQNFQRTAPPPGVMRACAEWEPCERVLIRWPLGISVPGGRFFPSIPDCPATMALVTR